MQGLNPDGTRNPALPVLLDVDNLINYMLIIFYTGGYDIGPVAIPRRQPGQQLVRRLQPRHRRSGLPVLHPRQRALARRRRHGPRLADHRPHGPVQHTAIKATTRYFNPQYLHQDLLAHPEYRQRIIEKAQEYFFNDGPMTPAASIARLQQRIRAGRSGGHRRGGAVGRRPSGHRRATRRPGRPRSIGCSTPTSPPAPRR